MSESWAIQLPELSVLCVYACGNIYMYIFMCVHAYAFEFVRVVERNLTIGCLDAYVFTGIRKI